MKRCGLILFSVISEGPLGWHAVEFCFLSGQVQNVPNAKSPIHAFFSPHPRSPALLGSLFPVFQMLAYISLPQKPSLTFSGTSSRRPLLSPILLQHQFQMKFVSIRMHTTHLHTYKDVWVNICVHVCSLSVCLTLSTHMQCLIAFLVSSKFWQHLINK